MRTGARWRAFTDPKLLGQWWGRGNKLDIERMEVERGGHWRCIEHGPEGAQGFEGRYREVTPPERLVQTFEWDGMPGYVAVSTATFEDLGDGRTKVVTTSLFHTTAEGDGMLSLGNGERTQPELRRARRAARKDWLKMQGASQLLPDRRRQPGVSRKEEARIEKRYLSTHIASSIRRDRARGSS